jgi:hypothetical protein
MQELQFVHLNEDWNAHPNAPSVSVQFYSTTAELEFLLNPWKFEANAGEIAAIRFSNCSRWNWDATNDHTWFSGEGRYAKQAPKWGEFYEVVGEEILGGAIDWEILSADVVNARHFLFYFRDETLEFIATDWSMTRSRR